MSTPKPNNQSNATDDTSGRIKPIKDILKDRLISGRDLAHLAGINEVTLYRVLRGFSAHRGTLRKILVALEIPTEHWRQVFPQQALKELVKEKRAR